MIDPNTLKLNQTIYMASVTNDSFRQKRISYTDDNGVEWFRYDRPRYRAVVDELRYTGRVHVSVEGFVDPDDSEDTVDRLYFQDVDSYFETRTVMDILHPQGDIVGYFYTSEEAQEAANLKRDKLNE